MVNTPRHIADVGGYIHFSSNTQGQCGRPIKIHTNLFVDFFCAVNPDTYEGQTVIRDIESLRAKQPLETRPTAAMGPRDVAGDSAAHKARLNSVRHKLAAFAHQQDMAAEKRLTTKNVQVFYHIDQRPGDKYQTVYISEVQVVQEGSGQAGGLYDLKRSGYSEKMQKSSNRNLDGRSVFISGASDTVLTARKNALTYTDNTNPALFFSPMSVASDLRHWKVSRLQMSTQKLIDDLQGLVRENQKRKLTWLVEGEGAALLSHALDGIPGDLTSHSFKFINAKGPLAGVLKKLGQRKAQLKGEMIRYSGDRAALLTIASQKQDILNQLGKLPVQPGYEKITRRYLTERVAALGEVSSAKAIVNQPAALRGGVQTFVDALRGAYKGVR